MSNGCHTGTRPRNALPVPSQGVLLWDSAQRGQPVGTGPRPSWARCWDVRKAVGLRGSSPQETAGAASCLQGRRNGKGKQKARSRDLRPYLQRVLDGVGVVPQGAEGEGPIGGARGRLQRLGQGGHHGQHVSPRPLRARVQQRRAGADAARLQVGACRQRGQRVCPSGVGTHGGGSDPSAPRHSRASSVSTALTTPSSSWKKSSP